MGQTFDAFSPQQIDIFREIGNIGSGNAVTALSNLLDREISTSVPDVQVVPFDSVVNILNGPESLVVGFLVDMAGDLDGYILMIMEARDAYEMASIVLQENRPAPADMGNYSFSETEASALSEMANILVGSYLSAICNLTGLSVRPSVPQMAMDMVGAILSIVAIEYGQVGDSVLFMKTQFSEPERDMHGHFFLIPNYNSYKTLMNSLGFDL